jgi:hypothetical protein
MFQDTHLFHTHARDLGGRLDHDRIHDELIRRYNYLDPAASILKLLEEFQRETSFGSVADRILFDYIFDARAGASAFKRGGLYLFGVNFGFVDTAVQVAYLLFSQPDFGTPFDWMLDLGDAESTGEDLATAATPVEHRIISHRPGSSTSFRGYPRPRHPTRAVLATVVARMATEFAFLHELSHVLCGHLDLPGSFIYRKGIDGADSGLSESVQHPAQYLIEYDADMFALQMYCYSESVYESLGCTIAETTASYIAGDYEELDSLGKRRMLSDYLLATALLITFLLFSQEERETPAGHRPTTHPHPLTRIAAMEARFMIEGELGNRYLGKDLLYLWSFASAGVFSFWKEKRIKGYEHLDTFLEKRPDLAYESVHASQRGDATSNPYKYTVENGLRMSSEIYSYLLKKRDVYPDRAG